MGGAVSAQAKAQKKRFGSGNSPGAPARGWFGSFGGVAVVPHEDGFSGNQTPRSLVPRVGRSFSDGDVTLHKPVEEGHSFLEVLATKHLDIVSCFRKSFSDVIGVEPSHEDEYGELEPEMIESVAQHLCKTLAGKMKEEAVRLKAHDNSARIEAKARIRLGEKTKSLGAGFVKTFKQTMDEYTVKKSASMLRDKFAIQGDFADLSAFHKGLDGYIGLPHPSVFAAMEREHLQHPDADKEFSTLNYNQATTTIRLEWEIVMKPDLSKQYTGGRNAQTIHYFLEHEQAKEAKLEKSEVVALRLFTGPMYMYYNRVLRDMSKNQGQSPDFVTTIHAISSGIIKLMRVWKMPKERKVYRGLSGMVLPEKFWKFDEYDCRGGVELSFMSTSTRKDVALQYTKHGSGKQSLTRSAFPGA